MADLTALDIAVLLLVGSGTFLGFSRGLVQEVVSLAAWIAAIIAVRLFHAPVTELLAGKIGTTGGGAVLAYAIVFGGVFAIGKWLSRSIGERSRASIAGGFDRGLGAGFGAVKGLIVAALLFMLALLVYDIGYGGDSARPKWMTDSRTYPALSATSAALSAVIAERRDGDKSDKASRAPGA